MDRRKYYAELNEFPATMFYTDGEVAQHDQPGGTSFTPFGFEKRDLPQPHINRRQLRKRLRRRG